jgi:hypothetical protein
MTVPFAFANLSGNIALAKLDSNFNTPITIGNTSVLLGNTITTINNVTLANVTISSGTVSNISLTSPLAVSSGGTGSANLTVNNVLIGNGTSAVTSVAPGTTGNVLTSIGGAWVSNVAISGAAAGANTQVQYNNSGALGASANLTFDGTNLGVGTSSPAYKVQAVSSGGLNVIASTSSDASGATVYMQANGSTAGVFGTLTNHSQTFVTNNTERMRLDTSGNLLVGTTSSLGSKFGVLTSAQTGIISQQNTTGGYCYIANALTNAGTFYFHNFLAAATGVGSITSNGTTTSYNVTSDQRLKQNIVDAPEFGSVIDSLQVRSFDWKSDGNHQRAGFVAQELVTVAPEAVHQPADPDEMMAVDYSKLVPMLVKEIQSLRIRIAQLENKL